MPMMRRESTIESYWKNGAEIAKLCSGAKYGEAVLKNLAVERNVSYESLHLMRQLADWPIEQVHAADTAGMPWNAVVPLINYGPSLKELEIAEQNGVLRRALAKRTTMISTFIGRFASKELSGTAFISAVRQWRADHIHLWSPGKQRRRMFDHAAQAKKKLQSSISAMSVYEAGLLKRRVEGDEAELKKVKTALSLMHQASVVLASA